MLLCGKLAPAVMTGNTIIIKPSPFTPYCGIKIVELAQRFFPPGVIQVLSGDDSLGPWLTAHPGVDKISFTGSTATGKKVMESASKNLTRITLELYVSIDVLFPGRFVSNVSHSGGNDAAIVCSDVNVEETAIQVANAAFLNSGQICIAIKRIYVHKDIFAHFRDAFVKYVSALKIGNGLEAGTFLGPVQNELQYDRVRLFLDDIQRRKQAIATGGSVVGTASDGLFVHPTVIDNPPDDSKIVVEEPFGPIVPLLEWSDVDEVIDRANTSNMGLGSSVWTNDQTLAQRIAEDLEVGSVWTNEHLAIRPTAAFGGHKKSGIGAAWGLDGLRAYCNTQTLYFRRASA